MKKLFLVLMMVALFSSATLAQKRKTAATSYSNSALDLNVEELPAQYRGHSFNQLFTSLYTQKNQWEKREFETTAQYESRLDALRRKPLYGQVSVGAALGFMVTELTSEYDADKQSLLVSIESDEDMPVLDDWSEDILNGNFLGYRLSGVNRILGTFIAQNAFGMKWRAQKKEGTYLYLYVPASTTYGNGNSVKIGSVNGLLRIEIEQCTPTLARHYKKNLRLLLVGKLQSPYVAYTQELDAATVDNPVHFTMNNFGLYFKVEQYWVYDFLTGEILGKHLLN